MLETMMNYNALMMSSIADFLGAEPIIYFVGVWVLIGICKGLRLLMVGEK